MQRRRVGGERVQQVAAGLLGRGAGGEPVQQVAAGLLGRGAGGERVQQVAATAGLPLFAVGGTVSGYAR